MKIKTTWGRIFKNSDLVLFNNFPEIMNKLEKYEELYQFLDDEDEIYQWFIVGDFCDVDWLKKYCPEIGDDIHYSETLDLYILAVKHLGTSWDYVPTELIVDDESLADFYQKTYHDDLSKDVKEMVFGEKTYDTDD